MALVTSNASREGTKKRQASYRERMRAAGFEEVCVWVPKGAAADVYALGRKLRENTDLQVGPVRSVSTGKLSSSR